MTLINTNIVHVLQISRKYLHYNNMYLQIIFLFKLWLVENIIA